MPENIKGKRGRPKKVVENNIPKVVTQNIVDESKEKENEELKKQVEQLQAMVQSLLANQALSNQGNKVVVKEEESEVVIGCRVIQGVGWGDPRDPSGEIRLRFGEEQSVTVTDMKRFFRSHSVRKLFENGLCYFANEEDYSLFNIRKHIDLSDENLMRIFSENDTNKIISELDILTSSKKDSSVINCLIFRICDLIRKNKLTWDYYKRKAIESYFKTDFDRGITTLNMIERMRM